MKFPLLNTSGGKQSAIEEARSPFDDPVTVGLSARVGNDVPIKASKFLGDLVDYANPVVNLDRQTVTNHFKPITGLW